MALSSLSANMLILQRLLSHCAWHAAVTLLARTLGRESQSYTDDSLNGGTRVSGSLLAADQHIIALGASEGVASCRLQKDGKMVLSGGGSVQPKARELERWVGWNQSVGSHSSHTALPAKEH